MMTRKEAAVFSAYTGFLCGPFEDLQSYADKLFNRPTWTHEFGNLAFATELNRLAKPDFIAIVEKLSKEPKP